MHHTYTCSQPLVAQTKAYYCPSCLPAGYLCPHCHSIHGTLEALGSERAGSQRWGGGRLNPEASAVPRYLHTATPALSERREHVLLDWAAVSEEGPPEGEEPDPHEHRLSRGGCEEHQSHGDTGEGQDHPCHWRVVPGHWT
jgi:hypothetical protein